jgi:hypothetical protein
MEPSNMAPSAQENNDIGTKPIEEDPTNDGPDRINNRIRSADYSELGVGNAQFIAKGIFQGPKGAICSV